MSVSKTKRERMRQGLCPGCGKKPKAGLLRCEACLQRQRDYDKTFREKRKGATVEPQCNVSGKLRAEHVYDEDGLCDCGARKMEFAPRPALRPEMVRPPKPKQAKPIVTPPPVVVRATAPAPAAREASPPKAKKRQPAPPRPEKRIGGATFSELIGDLERQRDETVECIEALRRVEAWWPRT